MVKLLYILFRSENFGFTWLKLMPHDKQEDFSLFLTSWPRTNVTFLNYLSYFAKNVSNIVSTAGICPGHQLNSITEIRATKNINLKGFFLYCRNVFVVMLKVTHGSEVSIIYWIIANISLDLRLNYKQWCRKLVDFWRLLLPLILECPRGHVSKELINRYINRNQEIS